MHLYFNLCNFFTMLFSLSVAYENVHKTSLTKLFVNERFEGYSLLPKKN